MASNSGGGVPEGIAPIAKMPVELITNICWELADDATSLARLAQTCRSFNHIAESILYREIKDDRPSHKRMADLLLALDIDPVRQNYIRSMKLGYWRHNPTPGHLNGQTQTRHESFVSVLRSLFGAQVEDPKNQHALVIVMALACLAPSLTTLEITASDANYDTDIVLDKATAQARGRINVPKHTLDRLTNLTVNYTAAMASSARRYGVNLHKLVGIIRSAPNLRSLSIDWARGGTSMAARLQNLTTLRLTKAYLCTRGLRNLTRSCTKLIHFEMKYDTDCMLAGYLPVSPAQVLDCLAPCRATLQKLHIGSYNPDPGHYPRLSSLGNFPSLKQVAVCCSGLESPLDSQALVDLVQGCSALEGFFLMGLETFPRDQFACFTRAALEDEMALW